MLLQKTWSYWPRKISFICDEQLRMKFQIEKLLKEINDLKVKSVEKDTLKIPLKLKCFM
jgi:hypothetical protein